MHMRKILRFTAREYKATVKTKGFIIGLLFFPLLMGGGAIITGYLKKRTAVAKDKHIVIIDRTGKLADALISAAKLHNTREIFDEKTGKKTKPAYLFQSIKPDTEEPTKQRLELSDRIRSGSLYAFVDIGPNVVHPKADDPASRILFFARNAVIDDVRNWIAGPINLKLRSLRLADAGVKESEVKDLFNWIDPEGLEPVTINEKTGKANEAEAINQVKAMVVPFIMFFLMYMMTVMSGPGMLSSVMEEKTQRIAEVLLGSISPFEFMSAKVLGGVAVSLTTAVLYIIGGALAVRYMGYSDYIPYPVIPWFFVFMLLAIIMFSSMGIALGAMCNEAKDAQSLSFPVMLPSLIPLFVFVPIAQEPLSSFSTWWSLIPPFTPMLMVLRMASPAGVPDWQLYAGLAGVLLCTLFFVWIAARVFRIAILMQGTPPKMSNIIRWAIRG